MSTDPPGEDVQHQWRVCGRWTTDGSWTGTWHDGVPSGTQVDAVLERNAFCTALWLELRTVATKIRTQTLKGEIVPPAPPPSGPPEMPPALTATELPPAVTAHAVSEGVQIEARAPRVVISHREASALLEHLRVSLQAFGLPPVPADSDAVLLRDALHDGVQAMRHFSTELVRVARQLGDYATMMESEAKTYGGG